MMFAHTTKVKLVGSFIAILLFLAIGTCPCKAQDESTVLGELKLEGKHIERLVLRRNDGHAETFNNPEETIRLPAGEYLLQEVRLKGAYIRNRLGGGERIMVRQGQQEVLKVGAPLIPTLSVQRQGRILVMSYELLGAGSEAYTGGDRSKPPTFAVYKGQKEVASGQFEFG